ncbi:MAG TPA: hypothetical protein VFV09_08350 [Actinomycetota bacterium]|nr:hypothetical protein [Actinomycetota bacterium]
MSTTVPAASTKDPAAGTHSPVMSWGGDMFTMFLCTWVLAGIAVDGWAHTNLGGLETFFTPWHALFYSGFAATATWIAWSTVRRRTPGRTLTQSVPLGYELGVAGLVLFGIGGVGDMIWHVVFGIEVDIDALLSPTHLMLYAGLFLVVTSPFRAAWRRNDPAVHTSIKAFSPVLLSASLAAGFTSFMFLYLSPVYQTDLAADLGFGPDAGYMNFLSQRGGVAAFLVSSVIVMSPLLLILRRWRLHFGSCALMFGLVAAVIQGINAFTKPELIGAAVAGGLLADVAAAALKPATDKPNALRAFAAFAPVALWGTYTATLAMTDGIVWAPELWAGSIMWTGLVGLGLSLLILPPREGRAS